MNKPTLRTIESETVQPKKSLTLPIIVGMVSLGSVFWIADHLAGNCLSASDVLRYCPLN